MPMFVCCQVVLVTAHFLRFGWGGPENKLGEMTNRGRVHNAQQMMSSTAGKRWVNNVISDDV